MPDTSKSDGTKLLNGLALGQRISRVWSDNALYVFQYTGSASVYDSRKVSTNCGLIAPNAAAADANGIVYCLRAMNTSRSSTRGAKSASRCR